jgi:hypothetical protein
MTATVLYLLLGLQVAAEAPMIPAFFTGESLHRICSRPNGGQCSMYVAGVLDGIFYARPRRADPYLCPAPINNREAAEIVTRYLERHPDMRSRAASVIVRQALSQRLDCDDETRAATGTR